LRLLGRRRLVVLMGCLIGLVFIGIAAYRVIFWSSAASAPPPNVSEPETTAGPVAALGRIEPRSEIINVGAGSAPDRLESLLVERGDLVKKDQVLGYLAGYSEVQAERDVYRMQLDEAKLRLKTETVLNGARVKAAKARMSQVLEVLPQRIAAQEATIESLEVKLANDKDILDSQQQLLTRGTATRRQVEDQRSIVLQGDASVRAARARLSELRRQFETDKVDAEMQIKVAQAALERMQAEFPIASIERQITLAGVRARRLTLYAPVDARILNVRVRPGEVVGSGPIVVMGDTERMRAVAEVYETDITRVRIGQVASISSRALAKPISGRVARIGNMIFKNDVLNVDPAARADARVVEVWIDLDDAAPAAQLTNLTGRAHQYGGKRFDNRRLGPALM
jgi:HlyD family secretion protein